jgi:hypothetical protein
VELPQDLRLKIREAQARQFRKPLHARIEPEETNDPRHDHRTMPASATRRL